MFISNRKATVRSGISYHFKGMFNFYRSITSEAVVTTGFLEGEISIFSAYNSKTTSANALEGDTEIINSLDIE